MGCRTIDQSTPGCLQLRSSKTAWPTQTMAGPGGATKLGGIPDG